MKHTRKILTLLTLAAALNAAAAETVILYEDFNNDYSKSFDSWYDGDGLTPHPTIAPLFYSSALESTAPWWAVRDRAESPDKFMASHSYYDKPGTSNDWLISVPLEIVTKGFILEFDAQSVNVRGAEYLSDLDIYITDTPIDGDNMPTEPTYSLKQISWGNDPDNCEGDWAHYTYELDAYTGKTIQICFVNQNTDKDIVCIDNIKVYRHDLAEVRLSGYTEYTTDAKTMVSAVVEVSDQALHNWHLEMLRDGESVQTWSGETLAANATETFEAELALQLGDSTPFTFVLTAENAAKYTASGSVTQLSFMPDHRVFMEETTSLHCGNCPIGMYTVESMLEDPELAPYVVPVSVHIAALGYDPMATADYYNRLPVNNQAPLVFVERSKTYDGFMPIDANYDPTNPATFAYRIAQIASIPATLGVDVTAEWVINGTDTVGVKCEATVTPAINIKGKEYRVAFVLTENNVGLDRNRYWVQDNYLSGVAYESRCGGWCDLGPYVSSARYHDVARAISAYHGHLNSLPADMDINQTYTYKYTMPIPDTNYDSNGVHMSDAIKCANCEISAVIIDHETGLAVNAARIPMSESATIRFHVSDLLGISDVTTDADDSEQSAVYYDLTGRRVANPQGGIFIRQTPYSTTKVIK